MKRWNPFLKMAVLGLIGMAAAFGCASWNASPRSDMDRLAEAYGAGKFNQIDALRYTFNVKIGDKVVSRAWVWEPQADRVTFAGTAGQGSRVSYRRSDLSSQPTEQLKQVDGWFINDNYWLIFPLRVHWDKTVTVSADDAPAGLPIGPGRARRLAVTYPPEGGYTPGDVYELFVDSSPRITQWIYRKGGAAQPTRMTTWEDYRSVGPLLISFTRRGPDDGFRVWFTGVALRLKGQSEWIEPN
jgi:hypothetical protein